MITRILPQEEWPRLDGTEAETLWPNLNPITSRVIVVEDEGQIVATWVMLSMVHAECLWIAPEKRGSFGVTRRLLSGMKEAAADFGALAVLTASISEHVSGLIKRLGGQRLPGETFVLPMTKFGIIKKVETDSCQQL